ncbi:AAA family ATPase [Streptomyces albidoflavus]|uniref:ATP-dependent nuclease n=1 Tax=Streptomyces albidoflavus TaxID=1886 RepID=UPI002F914958|nr:ATP-dependent endonuclease [Streptomyces albidoflavus]WTD86090.1 ATP-dependent endonuclease [Streptomyces albidoflavus]
MRLEHIKIHNFRGLSQVDIPFSRFGCLIGENNAGKSSVFQALNMFLSSGSAVATDFLDPERAIRIQMTFAEIGDADLQRLQESHRERMRPEIIDGRLTLARTYTAPGKGSIVLVTKVPSDERYHRSALAEVIKAGKPDEEVAQGVRLVYPEIYASITGKLTRAAVKRAWEENVAALKDEDLTTGDEALKTGMDKSVAALLPEPIYIPAVKELNDDLKTSKTATFGQLLSVLFEDIEYQLPQLESSFNQLRTQLNVVAGGDGTAKDERLPEVKQIESLIQKNLQESFPRAQVRLEIPPPRLRSLLDEAQISVNDGISGPFKTKGDGLRRSVAFAILRAYVDLKTTRPTHAASSQQPALLLFEEPEVFLHPQAQRRLFEALTLFSQYNDVLVSTHASAFCAPGGTQTFVKVVKDHALIPPASRTCVVDLSEIDARDQFEIITHENNEAAFFASSVLLVEGPSDRTLLTHIARTLNPQWDFDKHGAAIAKVEGKGSIERYRSFFQRFEMRVAVVADLDVLLSGFDKLGASLECRQLRDKIKSKVEELAAAENFTPSSDTLRSIAKSNTARSLWEQAQFRREEHAQRLCTFEELNAAIDAFFARSTSRLNERILAEAKDPELKEMKTQLLRMLRREDIYVWERGAIEDYYPALQANESNNKNNRAQRFCEQYTTADSIRSLPAFRDADACEFDLIFEAFFQSPPSGTVKIPGQAASPTGASPATTLATG